jgi:ABC-type phosphate/phosphonate transport system substrate-binding protein
VFTAREDFPKDVEQRFLEALFSMTYDDPEQREIMDMEGLKQWVPGRDSGFGLLSEAIEEQRFFPTT